MVGGGVLYYGGVLMSVIYGINYKNIDQGIQCNILGSIYHNQCVPWVNKVATTVSNVQHLNLKVRITMSWIRILITNSPISDWVE